MGNINNNNTATLLLLLSITASFFIGVTEAEESPRYNVVQLSGTENLDSLSRLAANAWSIVSGGFIAAVLVTGVVYLIGVDGLLNTKERRRISSSPYYPDQYQYQYQQYGQDRWGRRQDGFVHQMEKILSFLSVEAMQETASSVKHKILGGLSNMKDNSLQRVDDVSNALTDQLSDGIDAFGGGSKLEDCFLQAICYLTPDDEEEYAGESRKNKDKQTRREEKKKEKQKRKKNKKKNKEKNDNSNDFYDEDEEYDEVTETPEDDSVSDQDNVDSEDCEVFKCDMVRYGYQIFQLYDKVQNLRSKIDSLREDK